ncbi:MAG TPA: hypothetical protein PLU43_05415, partial [Lachnospiraceae bacterium]|nr:hypothetical protein [Lachnospiraceae bacterium]
MENPHIIRANKVLFIVVSIVTVFWAAGLFSQLVLSDESPLISIIPLIMLGMIYIGDLVVHFRKKLYRVFLPYVVITFLIFYAIVLLTARSNLTYPFLIPVMFAFIPYQNKKVSTISGIYLIIINAIKIGTIISKTEDMNTVNESIMIEFTISVLCGLVLILGTRLIIRFFEESSVEVQKAALHNKEMAEKVVNSAKFVLEKVEHSGQALNSITENTSAVSETIEDISKSALITSENIEQQTEMTGSI